MSATFSDRKGHEFNIKTFLFTLFAKIVWYIQSLAVFRRNITTVHSHHLFMPSGHNQTLKNHQASFSSHQRRLLLQAQQAPTKSR
mmetsp:Transcript_11885/g.24744  ORF Transcript_11885/g.24744 Transcript_11885/m.24744 type:complete len:85 (+) Transcript_11885:10-264(+)